MQTSTKFQFHYGTIKSKNNNYPTLDMFRFQFHYGTIKRVRPFPKLPWLVDFNSTMVRLKAKTARGTHRDTQFQFHYGTIKREGAEAEVRGIRGFQFHYGTIKRFCRLENRFDKCISIPLWYD